MHSEEIIFFKLNPYIIPTLDNLALCIWIATIARKKAMVKSRGNAMATSRQHPSFDPQWQHSPNSQHYYINIGSPSAAILHFLIIMGSNMYSSRPV